MLRGFRWRIVAILFLSTVINYIDRQTLSVLAPLLKRHEGLKIVLEHITTREGVAFVEANPGRMGGTITPPRPSTGSTSTAPMSARASSVASHTRATACTASPIPPLLGHFALVETIHLVFLEETDKSLFESFHF